jgi:GTP-binding protein HflX
MFNRLTQGATLAMDKLFATLDAKTAKIAAEMPRETVVIDTVGFIRKLPHHLVASFRSTMEEAVSADLVLHVIDVSHPQFEDQRAVGEEILRDLGIDPERVIDVYNKVDRVEELVWSRGVSALTGQGIDRLTGQIVERELEGGEVLELEFPHDAGRALARLHEVATIQRQRTTDGGTRITAWIPKHAVQKFSSYAATDLLNRVKVS